MESTENWLSYASMICSSSIYCVIEGCDAPISKYLADRFAAGVSRRVVTDVIPAWYLNVVF